MLPSSVVISALKMAEPSAQPRVLLGGELAFLHDLPLDVVGKRTLN